MLGTMCACRWQWQTLTCGLLKLCSGDVGNDVCVQVAVEVENEGDTDCGLSKLYPHVMLTIKQYVRAGGRRRGEHGRR